MSMFSDSLKSLFIRANKRQKELAKYLSVSNATISHYVNGTSEPSMDMVPKIAYFFRVSVDELFGISKPFHERFGLPNELDGDKYQIKDECKFDMVSCNGKTVCQNEYDDLKTWKQIVKELGLSKATNFTMIAEDTFTGVVVRYDSSEPDCLRIVGTTIGYA